MLSNCRCCLHARCAPVRLLYYDIYIVCVVEPVFFLLSCIVWCVEKVCFFVSL